MVWCCSVVVCLAQIASHVLSCLNESFTFISSLCGCFGITSFQSIFQRIFPDDIPICQEIPTVEVFGEKFKQTFEEIKKLLFSEENNHVRIIGLYGIGGVGKTTLLTELNNEFVKTSHGFDLVIWVVVSKDLDLKNIQDQIGKKLSLSWPEATEISNRATGIFNVLKNKKFVLLLDDIWKRLDLIKIGILNVRNNTNEKTTKSRIVFTTRIQSVCGSIGAKPFIVECLDEGEAWNLFHQTVFGPYDPCSSRRTEEDITKYLGLPLALLTTGRSMASEMELKEWEYALSTLRESASRFRDMVDEVLGILKFSYDKLENSKLKKCFLYCSLYPEDYPIKIEELIDLWIGEGFYEVPDIKKARLEGHHIIRCLKTAGLLESCVIEDAFGVKDQGVKMHDVFRELVIWLASSELGEINLKDSIQEQLNLDKLEFAERISLIGSKNVLQLTGAPKCVNLFTLLLLGSNIQTLSDEFFQYMPRLKVLSITPHEPGFVLKIDKLPSSMSSLSRLCYLNLSKSTCRSYDALRPGMFDLLVCLKILDLYHSNLSNWEGEGGPSLHELERLENLKSLGITIETDFALKKLVTSVKLQLCTEKLMIDRGRGITSISLLPSSPLPPTSVSLADMANLKLLRIDSCGELEELRIPSSVRADDKATLCTSLEVLYLYFVPGLNIVCDMLQQSLCLVNLKHVIILGCHERLEEIISDRFLGITDCNITFPRLQTLDLWNLKNLQRISNYNVKFTMLKHIRKLPFDSGTLRRIEGKNEWWESLEWEDEITKSNLAPYFIDNIIS
ncbi:hypothetical protein MKX01_002336 [Papaver californicum]|nr:hypothetical protein MKX01_002336 [Papaver californicum]